jgi:hypothetical protein
MSEVTEMPQKSPAERVATAAKDAVYIAIGLGVLAVQELQVRRHELTDWFAGKVDEAKGGFDSLQGRLEDGVKTVEERFSALEDQATAVLDELQGRIPESVKTLADQAIDAATSARSELFDLVGFTPAKPTRTTKSAKTTKAA